MSGLFLKIFNFFKGNTKVTIALIVLGVVFFLGLGMYNQHLVNVEEAEKQARMAEAIAAKENGEETSDSLLMNMQPDLNERYGTVPEGFIWDMDGTILSLGDTSMTAEDVVYAYFQGMSSLDIATVERYSRHSTVVNTYSGYFDDKDKATDYTDQFLRGMYRECMLSIQVKGSESSSVFAENKQVFTVKAKMLDLTNKDFWRPDQMEIYENLYLYNADESDSTKGDMYLYDYILSYYKSGAASLRDVTFDVTVQRYPDLKSGWLVSIDSDVDSACKYKDGTLVVNYIKEMYRDYGRDLVRESRGTK